MLDDDSENKILKFWEKNKIYEKLKAKNAKSSKRFSYFDGPPGANGTQHVGHAFNRILKDIYMRFYAMTGHKQRSQPGFDCMGLPVELQVQKELGFTGKEDILKYGLRKFENKCKEAATRYVDNFIIDSVRIGMWMNWDKTYYTFNDDYIETQWSFFKKCSEKKLLYKGYCVVPWCSDCQSTCSQLEVSEGYADIDDPSIYVKFKLLNTDEFILVWTTTPWSLLGNVAVAIKPSMEYSLASINNDKVWIGTPLIKNIEKKLKTELKILKRTKGKNLAGKKYSFYLGIGKERTIVGENFVTSDEGTGFVHLAPAHGDNDYQAGLKHKLPIVCVVGADGKTTNTELFNGLYFKKASNEIINDLEEKGLLILRNIIKHPYPHCWRCKSPLVYRTEEEWFLKVEPFKKKFLEAIKKIDWNTPHAKNAAKHWYNNLKDWCISRKRYYDGALPFWICTKCNEIKVIGNRKELEKGQGLEKNYRLFKSYMDKVTFECPKCKGIMKRTPEVADVWSDSAIMPYATLYPEGMKYFNEWFPADFILEAREQISHWFYTLMYAGMVMENKAPYKSVVCTGMITDDEGNKMSKSKGNALDVKEAAKKHGIDVLRYYYSIIPTWFNQPYGLKLLKNPRNELTVLYNSCVFVKTYLELNNYKNKKPKKTDAWSEWIISRLNSTSKEATQQLYNHNHREALNIVKEFFLKDFSRTYIKLIRPKLKNNYEGNDKESVMHTLYKVMLDTLILISPFTPFISEELYLSFYGKHEKEKSIHLKNWIKIDEKLINKKLETEFSKGLKIVEAILNLRNNKGIKIRWPLSKAYTKNKLSKPVLEMISALTNVKEVIVAKEKQKPENTEIFEEKEISAYLDCTPTKELINEALLLEISRLIQSFRKREGFTVGKTETITLSSSNDELLQFIKDNIKILYELTDSNIIINNEKGAEKIKVWNQEYNVQIS